MTLQEAIEIARTMRRARVAVEEILANPIFPPAFLSELADALRPTILVDAPRNDVGDTGWVGRLDETKWYYWQRLHDYLLRPKRWEVPDKPGTWIDEKGRDPGDVASLAEWSLRVLARMADPARPAFLCRGLVVGYVQSGKTANFTAVAARAADAGYRLIIVLSGIHNELRKQTQIRLDQELTGNVAPGEDSVGRPAPGRLWGALTRRDSDFAGILDPALLQGATPILCIVKKHCGILDSLIASLQNAGPELLAYLPTLIIDDEADQASVNTGGDRPPADADLDPDELEEQDPDTEPSRTNALIRRLIDLLPRRTYVGYTATPFANVLTDPDATDREVGAGLFPSDFILQLPRPPKYTGAEELFGTDGSAGRNVTREIPDAEAVALRPKRKAVATFQGDIPPTLAQAVEDFLLAGAMRLLRGQRTQPNTMLVHTSHLTIAQNKLAGRLSRHVEGLKGEWRFGGAPAGGLRDRLRRRWEDDFLGALDPGISNETGAARPAFDDLEPELDVILDTEPDGDGLVVKSINSVTGEELAYKKGRSAQVIAVGGNRLSRGLTLEGLTVSYYLRTTTMCDTLLQMARWFGYRVGYEDLLRIYMTDELTRWFAELAVMERDLRDEIYRLNDSGRPPQEVGVRIRSHSAMLATSRLKMKNGTTIRVGYSGQHPQTIVFPLTDKDALEHNVGLAEALVAHGEPVGGDGTILLGDVPPEAVLEFLRGYRYSAEAHTMDGVHLVRWIERALADGDVTDWTVYVDQRQDGAVGRVDLGRFKGLGMVQRSRLRSTMSIGTLVDPKHEGIDLPGGPETYRRGRTFDATAMRRDRPRERGLLMLYPISPDSKARSPDDAATSATSNRVDLFEEDWSRPRAVLGFALSLPFTDDEDAVDYVVGRSWARDTR